jgi:hypothetical protein
MTRRLMSALPPKADIERQLSHVGFGPLRETHALQQKRLFNHLVGEQLHRNRYLEAKRLGSL